MQTQTHFAKQQVQYFTIKVAKLLLLRHCQRLWRLQVHNNRPHGSFINHGHGKRTLEQHSSPSASLPSDCRDTTACFREEKEKKKKEVRKNDCVSINKARYPALRGVDSASTSLIITIQRKNELVNSVTTWKTGLW